MSAKRTVSDPLTAATATDQHTEAFVFARALGAETPVGPTRSLVGVGEHGERSEQRCLEDADEDVSQVYGEGGLIELDGTAARLDQASTLGEGNGHEHDELDDALAARLAPHLGQVRVSAHLSRSIMP